MKSFARVTKLTDIGGRGDYISNPDKQEKIVMKSEPVDWEPYQKFEREHSTVSRINNEGREVMIMLPNNWVMLSEDEFRRRVQILAETAAGKDTDIQWAVHWNKTYTNLHVHVIFSERQKIENPGRWDRNIYLTEDGTVARRKADRSRNEDGTFKPPAHRKGDLKDGFTSKDPEYRKKSWTYHMKNELVIQMRRFGVVFDFPPPLHEFHEGKGSDAEVIRQKNEVIRENNRRLENIPVVINSHVSDCRQDTIGLLKKWLKAKEIPVVYYENGNLCIQHFKDPADALKLLERTELTKEQGKNPNEVPIEVEQENPSETKIEVQKTAEPTAFAEPELPRVVEPQPPQPKRKSRSELLREAYAELEAAVKKEDECRAAWGQLKKPAFYKRQELAEYESAKNAAYEDIKAAEAQVKAMKDVLREKGVPFDKFANLAEIGENVDRACQEFDREDQHEAKQKSLDTQIWKAEVAAQQQLKKQHELENGDAKTPHKERKNNSRDGR